MLHVRFKIISRSDRLCRNQVDGPLCQTQPADCRQWIIFLFCLHNLFRIAWKIGKCATGREATATHHHLTLAVVVCLCLPFTVPASESSPLLALTPCRSTHNPKIPGSSLRRCFSPECVGVIGTTPRLWPSRLSTVTRTAPLWHVRDGRIGDADQWTVQTSMT